MNRGVYMRAFQFINLINKHDLSVCAVYSQQNDPGSDSRKTTDLFRTSTLAQHDLLDLLCLVSSQNSKQMTPLADYLACFEQKHTSF